MSKHSFFIVFDVFDGVGFNAALEVSAVKVGIKMQVNSGPNQVIPQHFEETRVSGGHVERSAGMVLPDTLKVVRWNQHMNCTRTSAAESDNYVSLVMQQRGGAVHRVDRRAPVARARSVTFVPNQSTCWTSEGPTTFTHFYLPKNSLTDISESVCDRKLKPGHFDSFVGVMDSELVNLLEACEYELFLAPSDDRLLSDAWCTIVAHKLLSRMPALASSWSDSKSTKLSHLALARVVDFVEAHLSQPISIETLASVAQMSQYHFIRAFRVATGETPHQYLISRRIHRARELLVHSEGTLAHIAYEVGFSSQAHMTDQFKKRLGNTPARFRRGL